MLPTRRLIGNTPVLGYVYESFAPGSSIFYQTRRWIRKPFWLPTAKSKVFRIPPPRKEPPDQIKEFLKLNNHYRTIMNSLRSKFVADLETSQLVLDEEYVKKVENEDFARCSKINDEWNKQIAAAREVRWVKEKEERVGKIIEHMALEDEKKRRKQEEMEARIRMAKQQRSTFITPENIDEAIEKAWSTVVNYDKVLDLEGKYYEVKRD